MDFSTEYFNEEQLLCLIFVLICFVVLDNPYIKAMFYNYHNVMPHLKNIYFNYSADFLHLSCYNFATGADKEY